MKIKKIKKDKLEKLRHNQKIVKQLSSKNLQTIVEDIMKTEDKLEALEKYLDSNHHFNNFVIECLNTMGLVDLNNN